MKNYNLKGFLEAKGIKNKDAEEIAEILKSSRKLVEVNIKSVYKIGACCI